MTDDVTSGFRVIGYFDDQPGSRFPEKVNYLGKPGNIVHRLKQGGGEQGLLLPAFGRSKEILPIISYCENHLIHFFSVPNVRNYLKRRMHLELLGSVPVLDIRQEPRISRKPVGRNACSTSCSHYCSYAHLSHHLHHNRTGYQDNLARTYLLQAEA